MLQQTDSLKLEHLWVLYVVLLVFVTIVLFDWM